MPGISIATLIGLFSALGLFISTILLSTDNYIIFISLPSLLMVLGGTIAATLISFHANTVIKALAELFNVIIPSPVNQQVMNQDIRQIIQWARHSESRSLLDLESQLHKDHDQDKLSPFLCYATEMVFHGYTGERLRHMLDNMVQTTFHHSMRLVRVLNRMATISPAFGMIGTLVGCIIMLDNMGGDPSRIGNGLAIALITTLYGTLLAQFIFKPAASKLQEKIERQRHRDLLLIEGFVALVEQAEPLEIQDSLNSFLERENHFCIIKDNIANEQAETIYR